VADPR